MRAFIGWPSEAIALVERAIEAHGGRERWREVRSIRLPFRSGSGFLLRLKGFGHTFPAPRELEVRPHDRTTIFLDYPDSGQACRYVANSDHRSTVTGLAKYRRWTPADAVYFFCYALCHYHSVPFTLCDADLVAVLKRGGVPIGVDVMFPPDVETHSRRQQFYFRDDGRIVRHDYVAEVIGAWAHGAHLWEDYEHIGGLLLARRRRVLARIRNLPLPINVLRVQFGTPSIGSP